MENEKLEIKNPCEYIFYEFNRLNTVTVNIRFRNSYRLDVFELPSFQIELV